MLGSTTLWFIIHLHIQGAASFLCEATYVRCGGIFKYDWVCWKFITEFVSERILKIGYHLESYGQEFSVLFLRHSEVSGQGLA